MAATILIVDDEKNIRRTLQMVLGGAGFDSLEAGSAEEGLQLLEQQEVDLVILDLKLPKMNGLEALQQIRSRTEWSRLPVIVISGHASVAEAVEAVQMGATDFFEKPLDRDRVLVSVNNALATSKLLREVERLRQGTAQRYEMIGESLVMRRLFAELEKVAPTRGRVLITGESGTGKELIARAIHRLSQRKDAPFVKVNCAAIPSDLIEAELFGHERGAFTGAVGRKKGLFEQANGGTLFLDEIGDMSLDAQAKVLRALQSGEITRVGSEQTVLVDVRVLAATNRDLEGAVADGKFREDLYFRLNVVPVRSHPRFGSVVRAHIRGRKRAAREAHRPRSARSAGRTAVSGERARAAQRSRTHGDPQRRPHHARRPAPRRPTARKRGLRASGQHHAPLGHASDSPGAHGRPAPAHAAGVPRQGGGRLHRGHPA